MPSKMQTRVDIPLNAAISIDVCIICGRPQPEIWDTAHGRNLLHECTRVPVPLSRTQVPMRGDFRRVEMLGFSHQEISGPILPSFPFQSTQIFPSNVLFKL